LKATIEDLMARGYKLRTGEGTYWAIIDYSIYLEFIDYINEDIAAYISFMAKESALAATSDAALMIPVEEIYTRARLAEDFINLYPSSSSYDLMHEFYESYIYFYYYGVDNTPAFTFDTQILKDEFKDSYEQAKEDEQISTLADKTADYLVILENNSYTLTDDVIQYRNNIIDALSNL
jgi:hypothetical protein